METNRLGHLKPIAFFVTLALQTPAAGCRSVTISPAAARQAAIEFDQGRQRYEQADYAAAIEHFDRVMDSPTALTADQYVDVLLMRSICRTAQDDLAGAEADLAYASEAAGSPALQLIAEASLLEKQGNSQLAMQKRRQAKRIDRSITLPLLD